MENKIIEKEEKVAEALSNYVIEVIIDKEAPEVTREFLEGLFQIFLMQTYVFIDSGYVTGGIREEVCDGEA